MVKFNDGKSKLEIFIVKDRTELRRCLQSVHHQKLDDKSLRFSAEVGKHALLKRHVVVSDI